MVELQKVLLKRKGFNLFLKTDKDGAFLISHGKAFHNVGATTEKDPVWFLLLFTPNNGKTGPLLSVIESCVLDVTDNRGAIVIFVHARLFKFHFPLSII